MKAKEILYIYVRVSTAEQEERDLSIPRQQELGIKLAHELGMDYKIFAEAGESASQENFDNRPQFMEILRLVKDGTIKNLYVFDQTRLSRNNITKAVISESLKKQKVNLYTHSKRFDFNKSEDELTFKILEAIETYETSLRKARFKLGYVSANKKGRYLKGIPPFGYKKDEEGFLVVDESERKVFLKIVDLYLNKGYGTNQIANYLNEKSIPTKTSKIYKNGYILKTGVSNRKRTKHVTKNEWNPGSINTMLKSEIYYGKRKFKIGEDCFEEVKCPALIDKTTFDKIQQVRISNAINKKREDKYFYLLKDIITCGNCGQPLHGRVKLNRGENTYRCNSKRFINSSCKSRGINITKLNDVVWNSLRSSFFYHRFINKQLLLQLDDKTTIDKKLEDLQKELIKLQKEEERQQQKLKKFIKRELDGRIPKKMYSEILSELETEAKQIADNKTACISNIKMLSSRKKNVKSELTNGFSIFSSAKDEIDAVYPCHNEKTELLARKYVKEAISDVTVTYMPELQKHVIEISFNRAGVKRDFEDIEPFTFLEVENRKLDIVPNSKIEQAKVKLPPVSNEYFLNKNHKFRDQYEKEKLELLKPAVIQASKPPPPFHAQLNLKWYDEESEKVEL